LEYKALADGTAELI
jgi:spore germination protein GerM